MEYHLAYLRSLFLREIYQAVANASKLERYFHERQSVFFFVLKALVLVIIPIKPSFLKLHQKGLKSLEVMTEEYIYTFDQSEDVEDHQVKPEEVGYLNFSAILLRSLLHIIKLPSFYLDLVAYHNAFS